MTKSEISKRFPRSRKLRSKERWNNEDIPKCNLYSAPGKIWWTLSNINSIPNKMVSGIMFSFLGLDYMVQMLLGFNPLWITGNWFAMFLAVVGFPIMLFCFCIGAVLLAMAWIEPYEQIRWRLQDRIFYEMENDL